MSTPTGNARIIEAWNTVIFDKFSQYQHLLVDGLGLHGARLFERFPPPYGARVLDVGCGFGDTSLTLASLVGEEGEVVGVDCAENFVAASRERAAAHGGRRVHFRCLDAQTADLGGPYDAVYARFGTMFFTSPVAALSNLRRSLVPGGLLAMSVWRRREDNPCFHLAEEVVARFIDDEHRDTDQLTCGPGPFSMASADRVSDQLLAAGFSEPSFTRFDAPMCIGRTIDEAVAFARDIGPAGEAIRLASARAASLRVEIEAALRAALAPYLSDEGVWAISSTWLVSARSPGAPKAPGMRVR